MRLVCHLAAFSIIVAAMVACGGGGSTKPTPTPASPTSTTALPTTSATATVELAPAGSEFPASGVCPEPPGGTVVTWVINPDIPSPRCNQIRPDQTVAFVNETEETIQIQLGPYPLAITSGSTGEIDQPVGNYLAPGVHVAHASIYGGQSGPEVWVIEPGVTPAP